MIDAFLNPKTRLLRMIESKQSVHFSSLSTQYQELLVELEIYGYVDCNLGFYHITFKGYQLLQHIKELQSL